MPSALPSRRPTGSSSTIYEDFEEDICYPTEHTDWIPHHIMTMWENDAGIRCITVLISLTGGTAHKSSNGIFVELDDDGNTLCISEKWSAMSQDMDVYYRRFKKDQEESDDDYTQRRFAMRTMLKKMKNKYGDTEGSMLSVYRKPLPFRVEPTEKRVVFSGDMEGGRYCHIDLMEKKAVEVQEVLMFEDINENTPPSATKQKRYK